MREILFRGKRKDTGEWAEGNLRTYEYENGRTAYYIHRWYQFLHEVVPETVGQYTGMTDKNGMRVFEGDILTGAWNTKIVVYYDECYVQFRVREATPRARENAIDYYNNGKLEIIGNIYDNPELFEA